MTLTQSSVYLLYEVEDPRPLAVGAYEAPTNIQLDNGRLRWQPITETHVIRPTTRMFTEFLNLADADDLAVLNYARRWGVLSLCRKHSAPSSHYPDCKPYECLPAERAEDLPEHWSASDRDTFLREFTPIGEPVSEWRRWAKIAKAILDMRAALEVKKPNTEAQWQTFLENRWLDEPEGWIRARDEAKRHNQQLAWERQQTARFISRWLELGNVHPRMTWAGPMPEFTLSGVGHEYWLRSGVPIGVELFGALAVHLLENGGHYVITGCTGCGRFFDATPKRPGERRPKTGYGRFCKECKANNVPVKLAQRKRLIELKGTTVRPKAKRAIKARKRS